MKVILQFQCGQCRHFIAFEPKDVKEHGIRHHSVLCPVCGYSWKMRESMWIQFNDLPEFKEQEVEPAPAPPAKGPRALTHQEKWERGERAYKALCDNQNNKAKAAKSLEITVPTLVRWLEFYDSLVPKEA